MSNERRIAYLKSAATLSNGDLIKVNQAGSGTSPGGRPKKATLATLNIPRIATVVAAGALTAADSGATIVLSAAAGFETTLPAVAAGLKFKFVIGTAPATTDYTVVAATDVIEGLVIGGGTGAAIPAVNENTISSVAAGSAGAVGDWFEVESDGTSWFVSGQVAADAGLTFTAP